MRHWATLLALLFGVAVAGCDTIHGAASAGGGQGGNSGATRGGQFILGPSLRF
jgi:hypothetical protein